MTEYNKYFDAADALDLGIKSPSREFLEKRFNVPICRELEHLCDDIYELYKLAYHDNLTGCYNRNMLEKMRSEFDTKCYTVIMIDLDDFKKYNTAYGHIGGDKRLQEVASALQETYSNVFRLGGDEFLVITELTKSTIISDTINKIGGLSAGVWDKHIAEDLGSAMHKADLLMYAVKTKKKKKSLIQSMEKLISRR